MPEGSPIIQFGVSTPGYSRKVPSGLNQACNNLSKIKSGVALASRAVRLFQSAIPGSGRQAGHRITPIPPPRPRSFRHPQSYSQLSQMSACKAAVRRLVSALPILGTTPSFAGAKLSSGCDTKD